VKTRLTAQRKKYAASLVLVLVVTAAGILLVSGVLTWTSSSNHLTQRLHRHDSSVAAAAAATEKVISRMMRDFQADGHLALSNNLGVYRSLVPSTNDLITTTNTGSGGGGLIGGIIGGVTDTLLPSDKTIVTVKELAKFEFTDAQGNAARTYVNPISPWTYTNIPSRYPGLNGYAATYRVVSNSRNTLSSRQAPSGVKQDLIVASIPIFHFQVFYGPDLEFNPGSAMTLNGRVHCNGTIYCQPGDRVTFERPITATRTLVRQKHPLDPIVRTPGLVLCQGGYEAGMNSLQLPVGTNGPPSVWRSIIEIPPPNESVTSPLGRQRLYNKADLIVLVSNNTAVAKSGAYNNFSVIIPWSEISESPPKGKGGGKNKGRGKRLQLGLKDPYDGVISTNALFFNYRENKTIRCTEIDITQLLDHYDYLVTCLGRQVRTIYVADMRADNSLVQSGVRIVYGETLPAGGLTIASPNPLYVEGDYNVPLAYIGTTNTSGSVPAALIGDAITLLSEAWYDTNSLGALGRRIATNTTVNAAIIAGFVPTGGGYYSGGLENLPRLLEDWTGKTLTVNGSLAGLFPSAKANAPWGARPDVYTPPRRNWSFDSKFTSPSGLPPNTPEVRTVIRRGWEVVQANKVN
jgi:hypothetical protein